MFFLVAYCISSGCRATAVAVPSLLPHEQPHSAIPAAACVSVKLSLTYLCTTLHHVIHTICFLLDFTSTTHGSCSLLHKPPHSASCITRIYYYTAGWTGKESWLDYREGQQIFIFSKVPTGSRDHAVCYSTSTGGFFPVGKRPGFELTTHLYVAPRLRIGGAIPLRLLIECTGAA